jgi:hypothetical protein
VLATVIAPAVKAEPTAFNPNLPNAASVAQVAPSDLVTLAQRGYLKDQGIPGYQVLASQYVLGQVDAAKLVHAAINAKLLPASAANNAGYLNAVDSQLQTQLRIQ